VILLKTHKVTKHIEVHFIQCDIIKKYQGTKRLKCILLFINSINAKKKDHIKIIIAQQAKATHGHKNT